MNVVPPSSILLEDYLSDRRGYRLDPKDGTYQVIEYKSDQDCSNAHARGFAVERRIGLSFKKEFFALYSDDTSLILFIAGKFFDLSSPSIQLKRDAVFPCVKRFRLILENETILSLKYLYTDLNEDGGYDIRDFFILVAEIGEDAKGRLRFMFRWKGIAEGKKAIDPEFQAFVEQQVDDAISKQQPKQKQLGTDHG